MSRDGKMIHTNENQLYQLIDDTLPKAKRQEYLAHIRQCNICSEKLSSIIHFEEQMRSFLEVARKKCPNPIEIWELDRGLLDADRTAEIRQHLSYCFICALEQERASEVNDVWHPQSETASIAIPKGSRIGLSWTKVRELADDGEDLAKEILEKLRHTLALWAGLGVPTEQALFTLGPSESDAAQQNSWWKFEFPLEQGPMINKDGEFHATLFIGKPELQGRKVVCTLELVEGRMLNFEAEVRNGEAHFSADGLPSGNKDIRIPLKRLCFHLLSDTGNV